MGSSTNSSGGCTYRFIESSLATLPKQINYDVEIRQQPNRAKVSLINERDRRPIEPPPILQLHWENCSDDELKKCLQSPFYFTVANLVTEEDPETPLMPAQDYLSGTTVSSLYRLRDVDNSDGGFFVFGDLAVKKEGKFKLRFSLFEIVEGQVQNRKTILSDTFTVFIPKHFPGPFEATFLSRTFSDQGVKMRIRKEHRLQSRKRKNESRSDSSSSNDAPVAKKYQSKRSNKMIVSSPPYAEPSSTTAHSDVFFGRWQATTTNNRNEEHRYHQRQPRSSITPPMVEETNYNKGLMTDKYRYEQEQAERIQAFPSPESTIYHPLPTRSMYWGQQHRSNTEMSTHSYQSSSSSSRGGSWPSLSGSSSSLSSTSNNQTMNSPPQSSLIASNHLTDSPPPMSMPLPPSLPPTPSLAKYHTCSDSYYNRNDHHHRLPATPPSSITELHTTWGTQLPPLKAIMEGLHHPKQPYESSSSLFPLLLPPPQPILVEQHASSYHHHYYYR